MNLTTQALEEEKKKKRLENEGRNEKVLEILEFCCLYPCFL